MRRLSKIRDHYQPRIGTFDESYRVLDWESADAQRRRFSVLSEYLDPAGKDLLDVGCGLADLCVFLRETNAGCRYTGIDILESMIGEARRRNPESKLVCGNLFEEDLFPPQSFDIVYCCGIFNLNLGNNVEFLSDSMQVFRNLSRKWVVVNLLHKDSPDRDDKYFYFDPEEVRCRFTPDFQSLKIIEGYLPNDFAIIAETR